MPFAAPNFPLAVNIWRSAAGFPPVGAPSVVTTAVLFSPHVGNLFAFSGKTSSALLVGFPKLTDVRGNAGNGLPDSIELPAGTGRFYQVIMVEDSGKGYLNEYRYARVNQGLVAGSWVYPTP